MIEVVDEVVDAVVVGATVAEAVSHMVSRDKLHSSFIAIPSHCVQFLQGSVKDSTSENVRPWKKS